MSTDQNYIPRHAAEERIFLSAPDMSEVEREALINAFDSNWIAPVGPALDGLEERLCQLTTREAAVAVNSGTAALHLGLLVLGVQPGDVVIVPSLTFVASANAVRYLGAEPIFVDSDPETGNIDPNLLEVCLRGLANSHRQPAAVMTVDLYGSCANYSRIEAICAAYDVPIIEDSAEAIGAEHRGRPAGSFGALSVFSFNGNKLVTSGGGGALVGPEDLISKARYLATQARQPELHFEHHDVGYAYRLTNLLAAIASAQIGRLDEMVKRTRDINTRYREILALIPGTELIDIDREGFGNGWLSVVRLDQRCHGAPEEICKAMAADGIEARPAWKPMHMQNLYSDAVVIGGTAAEEHFATGLCLPSGSSLTTVQQERVISKFMTALSANLRPHAQPLTIQLPDTSTSAQATNPMPAHARTTIQFSEPSSLPPAGIQLPEPALANADYVPTTLHRAAPAHAKPTPAQQAAAQQAAVHLPAPTPTTEPTPTITLPAPKPVIDLDDPVDVRPTTHTLGTPRHAAP